ncbi:MetQ/NlpA family ABC transporter substrate-binding protein [Nevskia sp.]|uniref:MetQ/NlpA family ABC transporter substrate-binding protein n=1 Tax=Nevskia sp. TaxID=1929292 RepID=UPI0025F73D91|nr:MetQ/NlpA family ABC transporter substrate-binding protein [Nevskia sp.]
MKRISMLRVTLTTLFAVLLAACGRSDAPGATDAGKPAASKVIKLGATAGCFADQIRWGIQPILEKKGYTIELTEFSDYIQPNIALAEGSLDANTFEHVVYLEKFASERKLAIQPLTQVPTAPLGLYSHKHQSLDELADGARIALPNDPTNQARALVMLEKLGWLTLKPDVDPIRASEKDVATNPRKLELLPLEAAQLPRSLDDVDYSFVNGNFAISSGLLLTEALKLEDTADRYINVVAIRTADADAPWVRDLEAAYNSAEFKALVAEKFDGFVLPVIWRGAP